MRTHEPRVIHFRALKGLARLVGQMGVDLRPAGA
jgi:hypothetical protein